MDFIPTNPDHHGNGTAIPRRHRFVSLEASIRECTVSSSLLECLASGTHSASECHHCRQHPLHPGPKLPVAQPVLFRGAGRTGANIDHAPVLQVKDRRRSVGVDGTEVRSERVR
jgi:hypothetical protein